MFYLDAPHLWDKCETPCHARVLKAITVVMSFAQRLITTPVRSKKKKKMKSAPLGLAGCQE